jgi:hypothetical protein
VKADPLSTSLWLNAGEGIARAECDGIVRSYLLDDYAHLTAPGLAGAKLTRVVTALVTPVLWHPHDQLGECHCLVTYGEKLDRDPDLEPGDFLFHDWFDYQLPKKTGDSIEDDHKKRARALWADKALVAEIRTRDRDSCRYCGRSVRKYPGAKGRDALELDHIDPFGDNSLINVVVACRPCNRKKGQRTPKQADMPILVEPTTPVFEVVQ